MLNAIKIPEIIAVSKTFEMVNILPLINHGHLHFGENKVQEAIQKWKSIKLDFKNIKSSYDRKASNQQSKTSHFFI